MALNWRTIRALPHLRSYEAAADYEAKVKPIRGDKEGLKPLGRRDQKYRCIWREPNGDICMASWNYGVHDVPGVGKRPQPIMRFKRSGEVWVYMHANSVSDRNIISAVLGVQLRYRGGTTWIHQPGGFPPCPTRRVVYNYVTKQWVAQEAPTKLRYDDALGRFILLNPEPIVRNKVNREGWAAVKKRYAPFFDYFDNMMKMRRGMARTQVEVEAAFEGDELSRTAYYMPGEYAAQRAKAISEVLVIPLPPKVRSYWWGQAFTLGNARRLAQLMRSKRVEDHYKALLWLERNKGDSSRLQKTARDVIRAVHFEECFTRCSSVSFDDARDRYGSFSMFVGRWAERAKRIREQAQNA